jgi:hypothetical protein
MSGPGRPRRASLEAVLLAHCALDLQVAADVVVLQYLGHLQVDLGSAAQPRSGAGKPLAQGGQRFAGRGNVPLPPCPLVQCEQGAPDPDHRPGLRGGQRRLIDVPAITRAVAAAGMGTVPHEFPGRRVGLHPFAKVLVLEP